MMAMISIINVLVNLNHFSTTQVGFSKSPSAIVYKRGYTTTLIFFKNRIVEK